MKSIITRKDFKIIAAILIVALLGFVVVFALRSGKSKAHANLYLNDALIQTISLDKDASFSVPGEPEVKLEVSDHKIRFVHSNCPDKICVNTGFIQNVGDFAACIPNGVAVIIDDK